MKYFYNVKYLLLHLLGPTVEQPKTKVYLTTHRYLVQNATSA